MYKLVQKLYVQSIILSILGLMLTAVVCLHIKRLEDKALDKLMNDRANTIIRNLQNKMTLYHFGLKGLRGAYNSIDGHFLTNTKFDHYTNSRDHQKEFPGALGFGFIRKVKPAEEAAFVREMRADQRPQFSIHQISPHSGDKYVIELIRPLAPNSRALGLDIASEQNRLNAAEKSMRSGSVAITAPITLIQQSKKHTNAFLLMLPYYATNNIPESTTARESLLLGWVYAPLVIEQVLADFEINKTEEQIELLDVTDESAPTSFFVSTTNSIRFKSSGKLINNQAKFKALRQLALNTTVFGRKWQLKYTASHVLKNYTGLPSTSMTGLFGGLISILIGFAWYFWRSTLEKERLVIDGHAKLAAIVESSLDAIIGKDLQGRVISWNKGAEFLFGYTESEAMGRPLIELIIPEERFHEEYSILESIAQGKMLTAFETLRINKKREPIYVSVSVAPVRDDKGNIVAASKTVRDITAQKEAEKKIIQLNKELEQKVIDRTVQLQSALNENSVLIDTIKAQFLYSVTNHLGDIIDVNDAFCQIHGYQKKELVGRNHRMLGSGLLSKEDWKQIYAQINETGSWHGELCNKSRDGQDLWFDSVIVKLPADQPEQIRYLSIRIDITEKRKQDQHVFQLNALLQGVLNAASEVSIIATDTHGLIEVFNTGAQRMLGYTEQEMVGKETPAKVHLASEIIARSKELTKQYGHPIEGFKTFTYVPEIWGAETKEWTYIRKDGLQLPVKLSVTANRSINGDVLGYLGIAIDLSEDKKHKSQLIRVLEKMQLAAKVSKLGIWEWDIQNERLEWNDEMYDIYQYPPELKTQGPSYEHWKQRLHPDDAKGAITKLARSIHENEVFDGEFRIVLPSGEIRHIKTLSLIERHKETGKPLMMIGVNFDVTLEKTHALSLLEAKVTAEQASTAKSQFLANMSHEIRTPLNAVLGMLQLLQKTALQQRQSEYVKKAKSSAQSLLEILNDVLDISKIEAGKMELEQATFSLEALLRELSDVGSSYQGEKDIELAYQIDPRLPDALIGDQLRLKQVLINLMGNAIKFTNRGNVTISVNLISTEAGIAEMRFSVTDSGIGISEEQLPKLFHNFSQAESATSRKYGGTGLGLAICNKILHLMNTQLEVESALGQGSTFWFDLKLPLQSQASIIADNDQLSKKLRLLIVDDNQVTTEAIAASLPTHLFDYQVVHTPSEAIMIFDHDETPQFDVVLMDLNLPEMNGIETSRRILEKSKSKIAPAIILMSAYELEKFVESGDEQSLPFNGFLAKPFTPQQVIEAIHQAKSTDSRPASKHSDSASLALKNLRILIVEDNALNRMVAQELLASEGADIRLAESGKEAIQMLAGDAKFDMILMDIQMPELDGFQTTKIIRQHNKEVPIVALTANATVEDKLACLDAGMNDHLGKPLDLNQVVEVILKHVDSSPVANTTQDTHTIASLPGSALIEPLASILGRFNQKGETYLKSLTLFVAEARNMLSTLKEASAVNNNQSLGAVLHAIKGAAATVGATGLAQAASRFEHMAKHADPLQAAITDEHDLQAFSALVEQTIEGLQAQSKEINLTVDSHFINQNLISGQALADMLAQMAELLATNNLSALELADDLLRKTNPSKEDPLHKIVAAVQTLAFERALTLINELKTGMKHE